jgi:hypothetical protein
VTLNWNAAADANQTGGLSYNLRVGTTPGGSQIVSPDSAPNGLRRVARLGNVQANLRWSLTNLPVGTYYWSVQAVDHAYAGSAFAPEQTFFRNATPIATPQLLVLGEDSLQPVTLTATEPDGQAVTFSITANPTNGVLTGTPPNLTYRPNTNFFGADRLIFQAGDGFTNSAPAMISLIVTQITDVTTTTVAIAKTTNGQARLSLTGEPYERYRLEASDDLIHWVALTNLISSNGLSAILVAEVGIFPRRFYRAAWAPTPAVVQSAWQAPGGQFTFAFGGELARRYEIQAATNLVHWVSLTQVVLTNAPAIFTDPQAAAFPRRFYRVVPVR